MYHRCTSDTSVAELRPAAVDVRLQLRAQALVHRRLLVLFERLLHDVGRAGRRILPALARPALVVLRRGEKRPVEALAEALERVGGAEEVSARSDLLVGAESERF